MDAALRQEMMTALEWYADQGLSICLLDKPVDRTHTAPPEVQKLIPIEKIAAQPAFLGTSDALGEAIKGAKRAQTLEELQEEIRSFDGLSIKKTATNMVFADGNPKAHVMIIGEAPGADEDRIGRPFVGVSGQLLDKILHYIGLSREEEEPENAVYISNILNWRPPGNRTPTPAEIELSLPFIERHIQLIQPKVLVLCGAVAAKSLLANSQAISKLRKEAHQYNVITQELKEGSEPITALATYHPSYLLRTPAQKKFAWADALSLQKTLKNR